MTRYLKALGLAMLAVFAMSAVAASGAQAEPTANSQRAEYPADVTGTEPTENKFTVPASDGAPAKTLTCKAKHLRRDTGGSVEHTGRHADIPDRQLPSQSRLPQTADARDNERLHLPVPRRRNKRTAGKYQYNGTVDLVCPDRRKK